MTAEPLRRAGRFLRWLAINLAVTLVLFAVVEGMASFALAGRRAANAPEIENTVAERRHTEYDPLLGWANLPDTFVDDMYGPGRDLTTDASGFRCADAEEPPAGPVRARLVVSGDSFTLGYGVDDTDTWVHLLQRMSPGLDTVNMGQGGYGFGQVYLWYTRDGQELPHDVHVFAFITENFRRMTRDSFMGYGKPLVVARKGGLVVENVPPPRFRELNANTHRFGGAFGDLRIVQWLRSGAEERERVAQADRAERTQKTTWQSWTIWIADTTPRAGAARLCIFRSRAITGKATRTHGASGWRRRRTRAAGSSSIWSASCASCRRSACRDCSSRRMTAAIADRRDTTPRRATASSPRC